MTFIKKLYELVQTGLYTDIIDWYTNDTIIIYDINRYIKMARFYELSTSSNILSVKRIFSGYGFSIRTNGNQMILRNRSFTKEKLLQTKKIVHEQTPESLLRVAKGINRECANLLQEIEQIKKYNNNILKNYNEISTKNEQKLNTIITICQFIDSDTLDEILNEN